MSEDVNRGRRGVFNGEKTSDTAEAKKNGSSIVEIEYPSVRRPRVNDSVDCNIPWSSVASKVARSTTTLAAFKFVLRETMS